MARLTKDQLRTDQLQHALTDARDFVSSHRSQTTRWVVLGAAAVAVVAAVWGGLVWRGNRAAARFSQALAIFDAPPATEAPPRRGLQGRAPSGRRRAHGASGLAKDARRRRPARGVRPAPRPRRRAAASGATLDAARAFEQREEGDVAAGVASAAALDAESAAGRSTEAVDAARKYLDESDPPLPKDVLVYTVAKLYEKTGQNVEAKSFYQRLVTDFPDSPLRGEAQQKLASL